MVANSDHHALTATARFLLRECQPEYLTCVATGWVQDKTFESPSQIDIFE